MFPSLVNMQLTTVQIFFCIHPNIYLFSVEQKNVTQGFGTQLSEEGGRYMASEKQVSNNLSISVLKTIHLKKNSVSHNDVLKHCCTRVAGSPIQVMDVVERWRLCKAHPCLPDVFTAVY